MKRVIGIALFIVAVLALVSCTSGETKKEKTVSSTTAAETETVVATTPISPTEPTETTADAVTSSAEDTKQHDSEIEETETESGILVVEDDPVDSEPIRVEEEIYYFDDADYIVNGLAVHFDSITLKRGDKPAGYSVYVLYQVENQNSTDATFAFSSLNGNCFEVDGSKATLSAQTSWSSSHTIKFHLKAGETSDMLTGDFFAQSLNESKTVDGTIYGPIDIAELYTGQEISIELSMDGYVGDSTESMVVTFGIGL